MKRAAAHAATELPAPPSDLAQVHRAIGDALFQLRVDQAKTLHARFCAVQVRVDEGLTQQQALNEIFGTEAPSVSKFLRWRKGGMWSLVSRQVGPRKEEVKPTQLALPLTRPGSQGSLRGQRRFRGLLRIPGTKASWVEQLAAWCPARFGSYFEPFLGGGALFFHLGPQRAVLSDVNSEFANLYRVLQQRPVEFIEKLSRYQNTEADYYRERGRRPESLAPVERAARTYFLNQTCFNGIYRVNKSGLFNVPYGKRTRSDWSKLEFLEKASRLLQNVELREGDFEIGLRGCGEGDFVYLDPPYDLLPGAKVLRYQADAFSFEEQERLAARIRALDAKGVRFLLSNADTPRIRELYRGFDIAPILVRRRVGGHLDRRGNAAEVLIRNYPADDARGPVEPALG
ncbi:MAG: Dam family site-specific DNA-(adenine-N6)-methyltransferase [Myxococcaceae bacterium]